MQVEPTTVKSENQQDLMRQAVTTIRSLKQKLARIEETSHEAIAIIGMSCRFPGRSHSPEHFRQLLETGGSGIGPIPKDRFDIDQYYHPEPSRAGKIYTRQGGFIEEVDQFDAHAFSIAPREAERLDPQQRILLECSWQAFQDAGLQRKDISGTKTGVFIGISNIDYLQILARTYDDTEMDQYSASGNCFSAAAGRISYTFGLMGPCIAIDTACSSSLVALHLACSSLRQQESDTALVAGVNLILSPENYFVLSRMGALSPDGQCRSFDDGANGYVRAEGCGAVLLKRLSDAQRDGDHIYATIRGSAVNQDGRSNGLTAPNKLAQEMCLAEALSKSGLNASDIDYIEAHGSGTKLGDPIEMGAIQTVYDKGRDRPLYVGSAKANLGHLESAAGIAGLIKVVLSLNSQKIFRHCNFTKLNQVINLRNSRIRIPLENVPWVPKDGAPRRGAVSSFGFSGINAHAILEEVPQAAESSHSEGPYLLAIGGTDAEAPRRELARIQSLISLDSDDRKLRTICRKVSRSSKEFPYRLAVFGNSRDAFIQNLSAALDRHYRGSGVMESSLLRQAKIAYVFSGQGSQYMGMARDLYREHAGFKARFDQIAQLFAQLGGDNLQDRLMSDSPETMSRTDFAQPLIFAVQVALVDVLESMGLKHHGVVGHSLGEIAAAHIAGILALPQAVELLFHRSQEMHKAFGQGKMLSARLSLADAESILGDLALPGLCLSAYNGQASVVFSGQVQEIDLLRAELNRKAIQNKLLDIEYAFHSIQMETIAHDIEGKTAHIQTGLPQCQFYSTVSGTELKTLGPDLFAKGVRAPVQFEQAIGVMLRDSFNAFIEIGPTPNLIHYIKAQLADKGVTGCALPSLNKAEADTVALRLLATAGYCLGLSPLPEFSQEPLAPISIGYAPWGRRRVWYPATLKKASYRSSVKALPILGMRHQLPNDIKMEIWQDDLNIAKYPYLSQHKVKGSIVFPGAAYIESAFKAASELKPGLHCLLKNVHFKKPLLLQDGESLIAHTVLNSVSPRQFAFQYSTSKDGISTTHAEATLECLESEVTEGSDGTALIADVKAEGVLLPGKDFYEKSLKNGNDWGPLFQSIQNIWLKDRRSVVELEIPEAIVSEMADYILHPCVSDAASHSLALLFPDHQGQSFMPTRVSEIHSYRNEVTRTLVSVMERCEGSNKVNIAVYNSRNECLSLTKGVEIQFLDLQHESQIQSVQNHPTFRTEWVRIGEIASAEATSVPLFISSCPELIEVLQNQGYRTCFLNGMDKIDVALLDDRNVQAIYLPKRTTMDLGSSPSEISTYATESLLEYKALLAALGSRRSKDFRLKVFVPTFSPLRAESRIQTIYSPLLGLSQSVAAEWPFMKIQLVEIEDFQWEAAGNYAQQTGGVTWAETHIALNQGAIWAQRLMANKSWNIEAEFTLAPDESVLIAGGLGGLGFALAQHMIRRGARWLVLSSSQPIPARKEWSRVQAGSLRARIDQILKLEALGAHVHIIPTDFSDEKAFQDEIKNYYALSYPKIAGIVNAVGVIRFSSFSELDHEAVSAQLSPKIASTLMLHNAFLEQPLRFFVLYSSIASVMNIQANSAYASANAFLDSFAGYRQQLGLSATTINWGPWSEIGMAKQGAEQNIDIGLGYIEPEQGMDFFDRIMGSKLNRCVVMPINWEKWFHYFPGDRARNFLTHFSDQHRISSGVDQPSLSSMGPEQKRQYIIEKLSHQVYKVLGVPQEGFDPDLDFQHYGFDSMMVLEMSSFIKTTFQLEIPLLGLMQGTCLRRLIADVLDSLDSEAAAESDPTCPDVVSASTAEDIKNVFESSSKVSAVHLLLKDHELELSLDRIVTLRRFGYFDAALISSQGQQEFRGHIFSLSPSGACVSTPPGHRWGVGDSLEIEIFPLYAPMKSRLQGIIKWVTPSLCGLDFTSPAYGLQGLLEQYLVDPNSRDWVLDPRKLRISLKAEVEVIVHNDILHGQLIDLSSQGCGIRLDQEPPQTGSQVRICLTSSTLSMQAEGRVRWTHGQSFGLEFLDNAVRTEHVENLIKTHFLSYDEAIDTLVKSISSDMRQRLKLANPEFHTAVRPEDQPKSVILNHICSAMKKQIGVESLDPVSRFLDLGGTSKSFSKMIRDLEKTLGVSLKGLDHVHNPSALEIESCFQASKRKTGVSSSNAWLTVDKVRPDPKVRLICFPQGGSGASMFKGFSDHLDERIEVIAIQPPGRESRIAEHSMNRVIPYATAVAKALEPYLDLPFVMFSYSYGALLNFETTRRILALYGKSPLRFMLSCYYSPHVPYAKTRLGEASTVGVMKQALEFYRGTSDDIINNDEMMELLFPGMFADWDIIRNYMAHDAPPFDFPITAMAGREDTLVTLEEIDNWRQHTNRAFELKVFEGDHFYIHRDPKTPLSFISSIILSDLSDDAR